MKWFAISAFLIAVSGCQVWLHVDGPQCESNAVCESLLGSGFECGPGGVCAKAKPREVDAGMQNGKPPLPARWACLRKPFKTSREDGIRTVRVRMDVVDVLTLEPPDGVVATACRANDVDCVTPVSPETSAGADGFFELEVPYGFEGYVRITAPDYVPSMSYDNRPYIEDQMTNGPTILQPPVLNALAVNNGRTLDPMDGLAFIEVRDCNDEPGDGVKLEPIGDETPFYFDGALPSRNLELTAISTQLAANSQPRAVSGFSNLAPTFTTFRAVLPETGDVVGTFTAQIRSGQITYVRLRAGY